MTIFQFAIARVAAKEAKAVLAGTRFTPKRRANALAFFDIVEQLNDGKTYLGTIRLAAERLRNGRVMAAGEREGT